VNALLGRPLFLFTVLWVVGELIGWFLFPTWLVLLLAGLPLFLLLLFLVRRFRLSWFFLLIALALPLGLWHCGSQAHEVAPLGQEGPATVIGEIIEDPQVEGDRTSILLQVSWVEQGSFRGDRNGLLYAQAWQSPLLQRGDMVRVKGKLDRPKDGFASYLRTKGAFWSLRSGQAERLGSVLTPLGEALLAGQKGAEAQVLGAVPGPSGEILAGILIGRVSTLDPSLERPYQETGTAHILAASGINISILLAFLLLLGRWMKLPRKLPLLLAIPLVLLYATLCGWLPSIFRAAVMGLVGILAILSTRERDYPTTLAFAALAVLVLQPLALFALDFQLSFLATAALFAFLPEMQTWLPGRLPRWLSGAFFVTLAAQLGCLPLLASTFHLLSLVAPLANILIAPLVAVILPLGLAGVTLTALHPFFGQPLLWLAGQGAWLMDQAVRGLASLPFSHLVVPSAPAWLETLYWTLLGISLGLLLLYRDSRSRRWATMGLVALFLLFFSWQAAFPLLFPVRQLEVHFINVGQGDAILLRTPQGINILWDGGAGEDCRRYLEDLGVNRLDLVFLSHPHADHLRGLLPVMEKFPTGRLLVGEGMAEGEEKVLLDQLEALGIPWQTVEEGFQVKAGPAELTLLDPPAEGAVSWSTNDRSLVGRLSFGQTTLLLTGDIEAQGRQHLEQEGIDLHATVLKVPHHGSASSLDSAFLEAVDPEWAVISVGAENSYGHPSFSTLALLEEKGVVTFQTSLDGTVILESDGVTATIRSER
jgi:competence protein ComEC